MTLKYFNHIYLCYFFLYDKLQTRNFDQVPIDISDTPDSIAWRRRNALKNHKPALSWTMTVKILHNLVRYGVFNARHKNIRTRLNKPELHPASHGRRQVIRYHD